MAGEDRDLHPISAGALHHDGNLGGHLGDADLVAGIDHPLSQPRGLRSRVAIRAVKKIARCDFSHISSRVELPTVRSGKLRHQ